MKITNFEDANQFVKKKLPSRLEPRPLIYAATLWQITLQGITEVTLQNEIYARGCLVYPPRKLMYFFANDNFRKSLQR